MMSIFFYSIKSRAKAMEGKFSRLARGMSLQNSFKKQAKMG
jgi:hypothetical protein